MKTYLFRIIFSLNIFVGLTELQMIAGDIIYPWRAAKAIVQVEGNLKILYDNINSSLIDSVILEGPYNRIILQIDSVINDRFIFDSFTLASVNNQIFVTIPKGTPEELYNLIVKCGGETHLSPRSVQVIREFKKKHSFIHITDLHISRQWVGTSVDGYAKELELFDNFIKVANIISPDFIIVTGDLIHDYTRINADSTGWGGTTLTSAYENPLVEEKWKNCYEGSSGFSGLNKLNSPVFTMPGNHDFYGLNIEDYKSKSLQWNKYCGLRAYGFSYGDTRLIAADDFLGDPISDIPSSSPMSGLQGEVFNSFFKQNGSGLIRIMAQHRHDRVDTAFINERRINILLQGHSHTPYEKKIGITPTLSIRPGVVCRSGVREIDDELGLFRIFTIEDNKFTYTPPIRFCKDPRKPYSELELNLTLEFKNPNTGAFSNNEAIILNSFPVDLSNCKIRFVMKKGEYYVSSGTINQIIQTDNLSVIDVFTDVKSGEQKSIKIFKTKNSKKS